MTSESIDIQHDTAIDLDADDPVEQNEYAEPPIDTDDPIVEQIIYADDIPVEQNINQGGRPNGTLNSSSMEAKHKNLAQSYAASKAYLVKSPIKPRGACEIIVKEAEGRFSIEEGSLNKQTLLT